MRMEPEIIAAELRDLGCPYSANDPRAKAWVEGHQVGVTKAWKIMKETLLAEKEKAA